MLRLNQFILMADADQAFEFLHLKFFGIQSENGKKIVFTLAFVFVVLLVGRLLSIVGNWIVQGRGDVRLKFWCQQWMRLAISLILIVGVLSIWFDDPAQLATSLGLVTAGLSFALQKVITSIAGFFMILRGKVFQVGDRIVIGGVRGDVIAIDFIKTTLMEIGQPSSYADGAASSWVRSRQFTGRIVTVSNAQVFVEPVYNYTRDFPYLWEEMNVPITYTADRARAEQILLEAAQRHTVKISELSEEARQEMERRYFVSLGELEPKVYYRLTDNWLELTVRFITKDRGGRDLKDGITRDILRAFDEAGIGIASATFEIVGLPPLRLQSHRQQSVKK